MTRAYSSSQMMGNALPTFNQTEMPTSLALSKKQLNEIKQVEFKVQNRVRYLAHEEDRMLGKISRM